MAFQLNILVVGGKAKFTVELPKGGETTTAELKALIAAQREDCPIDAQMLICQGKKLKDEDQLSQLNVASGATIYVGRQPGTSAPPSSTAEELPSKQKLIEGVKAALERIKRSASHEEFLVAMKTVARLLQNLCDHPDDPKYKRVRLENDALKQRLFRFDGGADALRVVGFQDSEEEPGSMFVRQVNPNLRAVCDMLSAAVGASPAPASSASAASGSGFGAGFPAFGNMPGGMPSMEGLADMMNNPMVAQLMSNPEYMRTIMPQVQQMMQDPQALQSMMSRFGGAAGASGASDASGASPLSGMFSDPAMMQQMQAAAQQLQSNPEMLSSLASSFSGGNFGGSAANPGRSLEEQEDAMLQEAIRLSMMDASPSTSTGQDSPQRPPEGSDGSNGGDSTN